jgi:hypothetical protein
MRLAFVFFPLSKVGALFALGPWAGRIRSTCSHRFELGDDHYAWAASSTISTITVSSVASAAFVDGSVGRGPTFLEAACLARGLVPSFLAFVFAATRRAAFEALVLAPVRLAAFLGAELAFLPTFPRFEAVPFRANARSFRFAITVSLGSSANVSAENRCALPPSSVYTNSELAPVDGLESPCKDVGKLG